MKKSNLNLPMLHVIVLLCLFVQGCAQVGVEQKWNAQSAICRSCHSPDGAAGARDFSPIYASRQFHHSVGVDYLQSAQTSEKFKQPNGKIGVVAFFDRNGNGQPDSDEVQLFGANGAMMVECASCHKEHGSLPTSKATTIDVHLRIANDNSVLCMTCHNM